MSEKTSLVREDGTYPVARTGIGNIALSAVQFEPELFRCMALKGAESLPQSCLEAYKQFAARARWTHYW